MLGAVDRIGRIGRSWPAKARSGCGFRAPGELGKIRQSSLGRTQGFRRVKGGNAGARLRLQIKARVGKTNPGFGGTDGKRKCQALVFQPALGSAEDYARIFGGSGRTGAIASKNCAVVACQSSMQRSPPVRRRGSGACLDTRRSNKPCATTISTHSVFPDSTSPPKPRFQVLEHARGLAEAEVAAPSDEVWREVLDQLRQADPPCPAGQVPDLRLELSRAFGAMRRSLPSFEMLKPRNLRSSGCATALFASLTVSRSFVIRNRLTEAITRSPARRLRT